MKSFTVFAVLVLFFVFSGFQGVSINSTFVSAAAPPEVVVRASVTGFGTSRMRAETDARNSATAVARGSYRAVSVRIVGTEGNFTCVMVIEYRQR